MTQRGHQNHGSNYQNIDYSEFFEEDLSELDQEWQEGEDDLIDSNFYPSSYMEEVASRELSEEVSREVAEEEPANYNDDNYESTTNDQFETSSQESQFRFVPYDVGYTPLATPTKGYIERNLKKLTLLHLRALLIKWDLRRRGNKDELIERLSSKVLMANLEEDRFNSLTDDMNEEFSKFRPKERPFAYLPSKYATARLEAASKVLDFEYALPHPWILEEKVTPPLGTIYARDRDGPSISIDFEPSPSPGNRYLLVALRLYRRKVELNLLPPGGNPFHQLDPVKTIQNSDTEKVIPREEPKGPEKAERPEGPASSSPYQGASWKEKDKESRKLDNENQPTPCYRHAYIRSFVCAFGEQTFSGYYDGGGKIHEITSSLRKGVNQWTINSFGRLAGRDYMLQIVKARRDSNEWFSSSFSRFCLKPASEVWRQLRRDFSASHGGIYTSAITISLRCPLSLLRLTIPIRSRRCKHPQCFDFKSWWSQTTTISDANQIFSCPICGLACPPDALIIDGLVQETLSNVQSDITEVSLDLDTNTWRPIIGGEASLVRRMANSTNNLTTTPLVVVDLTDTPDEPFDPSTIVIKPDPGALPALTAAAAVVLAPQLTRQSPTIPPLVLNDNSNPSVPLDEADVITNSEALEMASRIPLHQLFPLQRPTPPRGTSASDAIILD